MKSIFFSIIFLPSLAFALIFESGELRCAGDDNGNDGISGLAYCEEGDNKYYGEMKENAFDGIVFMEAADNSISLVEFNNDQMNGIGIQIKDNRFTAGEQKNLIFFGWNIAVDNIKSDDILFEVYGKNGSREALVKTTASN